MNIHFKALNITGEIIFEDCISIDATHLIAVAESRISLAKSKGRDFIEGAVPFFATELLNAAQRGADESELDRHSVNVSMAIWIAESLYGNVTEDDFVNSNLHFTRLSNGAVKYDRIRKS